MSYAAAGALALVAISMIAAPSSAQKAPASTQWNSRVMELERAIQDRDCFRVIDEGQYLGIQYFTDAELAECEDEKIEEILERNQKFVDHLECKLILELKAAAEQRQAAAEGVENAFFDMANPVPNSFTDLLRKVGRAIDVASVTAAWIDSRERNKTAEEIDQAAERLRQQALQHEEVVKKQRARWAARTATDDCPPPEDPVPPSAPEPIEEEVEDEPPEPKPEPEPEPDLTGRQIFRCAMDIDDSTLGRLVFCNEYDSDRIGQQPTPDMLRMSESICTEAGGTWKMGPCRGGWTQRCLTPKGVAHHYYSYAPGAPEVQCERWRGTLESAGD